MDGLSTLREIMSKYPRPVVLISSLTSEGAIETVRALTLGAVDFIAKPVFKANIASVLDEVAQKVLRASKAKVWALKGRTRRELFPKAHEIDKFTRTLSRGDKIVVIGTSIGGPRALNSVIPELPKDLAASVVIIQHMPARFTRSLAERLDTKLKVKEAEPGDELRTGCCLIAPGGFHMVFDANNQVALNQNPVVHGVRPAVDVTMISIAKKYKERVIGVILTGMGSDGTNGAALVHGSGGWVIAEAEESCVVWGMHRSVVEAGVVDEIIPLDQIPEAIVRAVKV
ncbi:MAG: chemotaxis-specific protein-glutamate methyltransferase CheB [Anaerolineaceae bacterium]|nr:chemotaxis-specific protein-glutamate methyltransferase CheB [Anaerolineaceae bacterium]